MNRTLSLVLLAALVAGCASSKSGDVYTREQARQSYTVKTGVVESVRMVRIEGTKSAVGTGAGAVVGGVAGSSLGKGRGSVVGAVVGAVAGGLAGSAIEEGVTRSDGVELTIKLDSGAMFAVVQEAAGETFHPGDQVRVLEGDGEIRVSH